MSDLLDRERIRKLIAKYASRAPRYTSYPTAADFHSSFGNKEWKEALGKESVKNSPGSSLYLHVPFCPILCFFCACNKVVTKNHEVVRPFLNAIKKELESYRSLGSDLLIEQLHWGGGSPNYLSPDEMKEAFQAMKGVFPNFSPNADISVELDPRTTTTTQVEMLHSLGFNRMSLGVQDFDPEVQRIVNRVQSFEMTKSLTECARAHGFHSVNMDLIYGLPGQTLKTFEQTLETLVTLRPDRVALYGYAHVTWISKAQTSFDKKASLPTPSDRVELLLSGIERLTKAGYRYIGMDHFALPEDPLSLALDAGTIRRNFMGYSTHRGHRIIGLGPSAISSTESAFGQNEKEHEIYQNRIASEGLAIERGIARSKDDKIRGDVIEDLMCKGELSLSTFKDRNGIGFYEYFPGLHEIFKPMEDDGLLTVKEDRIALTSLGRLFIRPIAMVFDAHRKITGGEKERSFSQAI